MSQLTLHLPDKLAAELAEASRRANRPPDELATELLQRALAVRRFRAAREAILNSLGDKAPDKSPPLLEEQALLLHFPL